ncbi:MAG: FKBP-type peptidyl-prolyl cis-trans isomerase [Flammeovirgaceae bacterium]
MLKYITVFCFAVIVLSCSSDSPVPTFEEQLQKDIALIDQYLAANGINAIKDSTGVRYVVKTIGQGVKPAKNARVYLNLRGTVLSTGTLVIDDKDRYFGSILGNPNSTLPAFQIVVPKLTQGTEFTIYSPSGYAYGSTPTTDGSLPANSNMIFEAKFLDEVAQFKADTTAIAQYLVTKNISAQKDTSGVRIAVTTLGTGNKPSTTSRVSFTYVGKLLKTESVFDQSSAPATAPMSNLIAGFRNGLLQLPAGSKATLFIPSKLGNGPSGSGTLIPGNSNLIFEVELLTVN